MAGRGSKSRVTKYQKPPPTSASPGSGKGKVEIDEPFEGWPSELRLGLAWFASSRLLLTSDFSYRVAPEVGVLDQLTVVDTWNVHAGAEYYITSYLPLRLGFFTNNDARPEIDPEEINQQDHIDYYGGSALISRASGGNQLGLGFVGQYGSGEAQKLTGSFAVQDVEASFYSVVIATSYTL